MIRDLIVGLEVRREALAARLVREDGVTAIEYGLIAALIAVVIIAMLIFVGDELFAIFQTIGEALQSASS